MPHYNNLQKMLLWLFLHSWLTGSEHGVIELKVISVKGNSGWKVSVFGVFLVRIFPHLSWIRRDIAWLYSCIITSCKSSLSLKPHFTF